MVDAVSMTPAERFARADVAARDFEAMFATQMLAPMWQGVEVNEYFGGGAGEETFRSMMLQEYGRAIAATGGLGLAPAIRTEMLRLQEIAP